ncbi:MarR family transcriptional regulator [Clostridiaceae bacterium]|nr:MarR family transcriptional regulator [Clostridiaceae bacterium]RKI16534.1 MarR family transcriptional regulator [bacterium 1XD21-70]
MDREEVQAYVNQYCKLRDMQYAAYGQHARKHNLTTKELFVLDLVWSAEDGCLQSEICERLSATKQTISAIIKKFWKLGYLSLTEAEADRRNKIVRFTDAGREYVKNIIPPAVSAQTDAMAELKKEDITELIRLTTLFSVCMKKNFDGIIGGHYAGIAGG